MVRGGTFRHLKWSSSLDLSHFWFVSSWCHHSLCFVAALSAVVLYVVISLARSNDSGVSQLGFGVLTCCVVQLLSVRLDLRVEQVDIYATWRVGCVWKGVEWLVLQILFCIRIDASSLFVAERRCCGPVRLSSTSQVSLSLSAQPCGLRRFRYTRRRAQSFQSVCRYLRCWFVEYPIFVVQFTISVPNYGVRRGLWKLRVVCGFTHPRWLLSAAQNIPVPWWLLVVYGNVTLSAHTFAGFEQLLVHVAAVLSCTSFFFPFRLSGLRVSLSQSDFSGRVEFVQVVLGHSSLGQCYSVSLLVFVSCFIDRDDNKLR